MEQQKPSVKIEKVSLREEIKNVLSNAIMKGEIKQGDRLVETKIAKEYGVSQAPVREAIRDLEQMGIVYTLPYKGTYVKEISEQDLKNVYQVRAALEQLAVKLAIPKMTEDDIHALEDIYKQMLKEGDAGEVQTQILLDIKFHEFIVHASGNEILIKSWSDLSIPYWTYFGTHFYKYGNEGLVKRHEPIIQALRVKDEERAVKIISEHFMFLDEPGGV